MRFSLLSLFLSLAHFISAQNRLLDSLYSALENHPQEDTVRKKQFGVPPSEYFQSRNQMVNQHPCYRIAKLCDVITRAANVRSVVLH